MSHFWWYSSVPGLLSCSLTICLTEIKKCPDFLCLVSSQSYFIQDTVSHRNFKPSAPRISRIFGPILLWLSAAVQGCHGPMWFRGQEDIVLFLTSKCSRGGLCKNKILINFSSVKKKEVKICVMCVPLFQEKKISIKNL